jgi:hypothetical protein
MVLIINHIKSGIKNKSISGIQPPKKKIELKTHITIILLYSAKKNNAKPTAAYSTLYPDTNSDSASGKSKGCLLVSANAQIKKIINIGNKGQIFHICFCCKTISVKLKLRDNKITLTIVTPNETSYKIICAAERTAPKKAYFELLDHPAIITE